MANEQGLSYTSNDELCVPTVERKRNLPDNAPSGSIIFVKNTGQLMEFVGATNQWEVWGGLGAVLKEPLATEEYYRPTYEIPSEGWAKTNPDNPKRIAGVQTNAGVNTDGVPINPQTAGCTRPQCDMIIQNTSSNDGKLTLGTSTEGLNVPANGILEFENFDTTDGIHMIKAQANTIDVEIVFKEIA